ncbi:uncharacterized protein LY79DRAFT_533454 [Colletotrichum navitas]|uniref:Uncharacterized protein n=1 Tax=Colletotrichum navitas TaxID=681940 RepID=A0AAD8QFD3_9PEZI|nr:uncharacterized protein LY79DRAFT_533454 [Colletotrichum navitas]KAK1600402.1 hypothetical protein LY79DRAFT_533454 [Colletotrichum navitas]
MHLHQAGVAISRSMVTRAPMRCRIADWGHGRRRCTGPQHDAVIRTTAMPLRPHAVEGMLECASPGAGACQAT